ncbi:hypothetical protein GXW82_18810 [Streptacidiphilus sp. 4-A2]|nr:hypothetical protein [Streptacidiphilus sp. 4-A2]
MRRGLVLRRRDPADGRRKLLTLPGRGQLLQYVSPRGPVQQQLLEPLDETQRVSLMASLGSLARIDPLALETMQESRPILDAPRWSAT